MAKRKALNPPEMTVELADPPLLAAQKRSSMCLLLTSRDSGVRGVAFQLPWPSSEQELGKAASREGTPLQGHSQAIYAAFDAWGDDNQWAEFAMRQSYIYPTSRVG
jgi:hypothetical protein